MCFLGYFHVIGICRNVARGFTGLFFMTKSDELLTKLEQPWRSAAPTIDNINDLLRHIINLERKMALVKMWLCNDTAPDHLVLDALKLIVADSE